MMRQAVLIVFLLLAAAACQPAKPDPAAETTARALFDDLRQGNEPSIMGRLPPPTRNPAGLAQVMQLRTKIPAGTPTSSKVAAFQEVRRSGGSAAETVAIQYDYPDQVTLLTVQMAKPAAQADWQLTAVQVRTARAAEVAHNRFTLAGKPPLQLGFLAYAVLAPLVMLFAAVKVMATPGLRFKWAWVIPCFIGVSSLQMNWTTGALAANWYAVQLVGAGFDRGGSSFDPWVLVATIPLGALLILGGLLATPRRTRKPAGG